MTILQKIEDTFNSGHAEIRKWFLIRNTYLPFILCLGYIVMAIVGPHLMRNRKPFEIRKILIIFNFSIVTVYATMLLIACYYFQWVTWKEFCTEDFFVAKKDIAIQMSSLAWFAYLTKYVEFFDTFFFILRKKEHLVTFLHVFHHSVVPILGWILFRTERSPLQSVPAIVNTIVHVVMYTYYGMAAMGPKMRKYLWWKKYLTQLQIAQFIFILMFFSIYAPMSGCSMVLSSYLMNFIFAPFFLYLFYRFYRTAFQPTAKRVCRSG